MLLGGAHQQRPRAPARVPGVHVDVEIALAGHGAVVRQVHLGGADHLAVVVHRHERAVVGVGVQLGEVVGQGLRGDQDERQGGLPYAGEALQVGGGVGAQIADGHCHVRARYEVVRRGASHFP